MEQPFDSGRQLDTQPGSAVYSSFVLKLYDAWVLAISNRWAWRCSTRRVLLPFYRQRVGKRHLEVGVGSGFYPAHADFSADQQVTLLDLNEHSLAATARRLDSRHVTQVVGDIMQPLPMLAGYRFDSIALFYLLHCLPGTMDGKAHVFAHLKSHLAPDGVLFGATVLGDSAGHNAFGRALVRIYNRKGIFDNRRDTLASLRLALSHHFADVSVEQNGVVALFVARAPL
ncbi:MULTISPECIES: class I SAM-dependent methyltransferase [unclassified Paraburkholderia]|uniref:class I SAM-dependent methyltransferase n=1 Tax=unclassified Paraburkholderia TaxID=2615204 RepID=UPI002AB27136|nr:MULTISPECIES: class I SAM-dependent methyltransferase [unclassified Paraburkholderia]